MDFTGNKAGWRARAATGNGGRRASSIVQATGVVGCARLRNRWLLPSIERRAGCRAAALRVGVVVGIVDCCSAAAIGCCWRASDRLMPSAGARPQRPSIRTMQIDYDWAPGYGKATAHRRAVGSRRKARQGRKRNADRRRRRAQAAASGYGKALVGVGRWLRAAAAALVGAEIVVVQVAAQAHRGGAALALASARARWLRGAGAGADWRLGKYGGNKRCAAARAVGKPVDRGLGCGR